MKVYCENCNTGHNIYTTGKSFVVSGNDKIATRIMYKKKKYLGYKCANCGTINIVEEE